MTPKCSNFHGTFDAAIDWIKLRVFVIGSTHAVDVAKKANLLLSMSNAFEIQVC